MGSDIWDGGMTDEQWEALPEIERLLRDRPKGINDIFKSIYEPYLQGIIYNVNPFLDLTPEGDK